MEEMSFHFMHVAYVILSHLWLSCHSSLHFVTHLQDKERKKAKKDIMIRCLFEYLFRFNADYIMRVQSSYCDQIKRVLK